MHSWLVMSSYITERARSQERNYANIHEKSTQSMTFCWCGTLFAAPKIFHFSVSGNSSPFFCGPLILYISHYTMCILISITAHLILVLYSILLNENNCKDTVTLIYILHEENSIKCKHVFACNICWPYLDFVTAILHFSRNHAWGLLMAHPNFFFLPIFNQANEDFLCYRRMKIKIVFPSALCYILELSQTPVMIPKLFKISCFTRMTQHISSKS